MNQVVMPKSDKQSFEPQTDLEQLAALSVKILRIFYWDSQEIIKIICFQLAAKIHHKRSIKAVRFIIRLIYRYTVKMQRYRVSVIVYRQ